MTRKKARNVGAVAVVAALAMVVLLVTIARGSAPEFHDESAPATLTISKVEGTEDSLTVGGKIVCSSEAGSGTLSSESSTEITYAATPSGCVLAGVVMEVNMEGCEWVSHLEAGSNPPTGNVDLVCPEGHQPDIKQKGKNCDIKFLPNQTGMPSFTVKNTVAPANDMDEVLTVTGLKFTAKTARSSKTAPTTPAKSNVPTQSKATTKAVARTPFGPNSHRLPASHEEVMARRPLIALRITREWS